MVKNEGPRSSSLLWRRRGTTSVLLTLALLTASPAFCQGPAQILLGYYAQWTTSSSFNPLTLDSAVLSRLDYLNYAFATVSGSSCTLTDPNTEPTTFSQLRTIKSSHPQLRVLLSIGGASSDVPLEAAVKNGNAAAFAQSCITNFFNAYPGTFDGVDIDWEFPTASDAGDYTKLVQAFRTLLGPNGIITAAIGLDSSQYGNIQFSQVTPLVDFYSVMAYDVAAATVTTFNAPLYKTQVSGRQDTYNGTADDAILALTATTSGAPAIPSGQLLLGVPFYGEQWTGAGTDTWGMFQNANNYTPINYSDIATLPGTKYCDYSGQSGAVSCTAPTTLPTSGSQENWIQDGTTVTSFDSPETMAIKAMYAKAKNLAGMTAWQLQQDYSNGAEPLMDSIASGLPAPPLAPMNLSVTSGTSAVANVPSSFAGGGAYAFTWSDLNGQSDVSQTQVLFNTGITAANACNVTYTRSTNTVSLINNAGTGIQGSATAGSSMSLSNSQCTITAATVSTSGNLFTLTLSLSFASGFTARSIYMQASGASGGANLWTEKGTWTNGTNRPPTADSVSPSSGTGNPQSFTFTYSDPNGWTDLSSVYAVFNSTVASGLNGCYIYYLPASNVLYLKADNGSTNLGALTPGGSGTDSNSQCSVAASGISVSHSGNSLMLTVSITFSATFTGRKTIYLRAIDAEGASSGFVVRGTWSAAANQPPSIVSMSPSSGIANPQSFTFTYSDGNGWTDLASVYVLFNSTVASTVNGCYMYYLPAVNTLYLRGDDGVSNVAALTPGASGTGSNSQCSVAAGGMSVTHSGNNLMLTVPITFTSTFTGLKHAYLRAIDNSSSVTPWVSSGTWSAAANQKPAVVSVSPSSGTGASQTFTFTYSDPNGWNDLGSVYALFNGALTTVNGCYMYYQPAVNVLYLRADNGSSTAGALSPGGSGTAQNSHCSVSASGISVAHSGMNLTLTVSISFLSTFTGLEHTYLRAIDNSGADSGFVSSGTWTAH